MKLTDGEKLILLMLSEIYDKLGVKGQIDNKFIESAIQSDNIWGISWKFSGITFEKDETPPIVEEVCDILDMFFWLEVSFEALPKREQNLITDSGLDVKYQGFDGNHEAKYLNVVAFLVNDLERYQEYKGREDKRTVFALPRYRGMLAEFKKIRKSKSDPAQKFNSSEITMVLKGSHK